MKRNLSKVLKNTITFAIEMPYPGIKHMVRTPSHKLNLTGIATSGVECMAVGSHELSLHS